MKKLGNVEEDEDVEPADDEDEQHDGDEQRDEGEETAQSVPGETKTPTKAVRGKFTVHDNGTAKYSGWSDEGTARFNELYKLVKADMKCPLAAAMEKKFLEYAIYYARNSKRRSEANNAGTVSKRRSEANNAGTAIGNPAIMQRRFDQAAWELDDEWWTLNFWKNLN